MLRNSNSTDNTDSTINTNDAEHVAVVRSIRRVAVETSNNKGLHDLRKLQKTKKIAFRYVLDTFFIEDLKDYLDT